jgi:hypothetical protein
LEKASRRSSNPRKLFDDSVETVLKLRNSRSILSLERIAPGELQQVLALCIDGRAGSNTSTGSGSEEGEGEGNHLPLVELSTAIFRLCNWDDPQVSSASVADVRDFLCRLCSFRTLQKRIQVYSNVHYKFHKLNE